MVPKALDLNMRLGEIRGDMAGASVFRAVLDWLPSSSKQVFERHKRTEMLYSVRVKVRQRV